MNESQLKAVGADLTAVNRWIVGNDTGTSSKTIWSVMMGAEPGYACEPSDPDDFGRCYRLLKIAPLKWRANLSKVSDRYPIWSGLVREWDALTEMFERVIAGGGWNLAESKQMYARMQVLIDEGRISARTTIHIGGFPFRLIDYVMVEGSEANLRLGLESQRAGTAEPQEPGKDTSAASAPNKGEPQ